jgi:hypothetical protein
VAVSTIILTISVVIVEIVDISIVNSGSSVVVNGTTPRHEQALLYREETSPPQAAKTYAGIFLPTSLGATPFCNGIVLMKDVKVEMPVTVSV